MLSKTNKKASSDTAARFFVAVGKVFSKNVTYPVTFVLMIKNFQHKGLRLFFEDEDSAKLTSAHITRIRNILTRLEFAKTLDDIGTPGSRLHPLSGRLKGYHAVNVSGNWRIIFRFKDGHVYDVDYLDYH